MIEYLSDVYIMKTIDLLKSEYAIVTGIVLCVLGYIVKKTKAKWDDKVVDWFKGKVT